MPLTLYNTLTRNKDLFLPLHPESVTMYSCGPTVYSSAHIGNMRSFVMADLIKRALRQEGYSVKHVMNITDVGHLIHDTDKDKMEEAAKQTHQSAYEIAQIYTDEFIRDSDALNIIPADVFPRATDHIHEQIQLIQQLEHKKFTYRASDGIYFDTSRFSPYGQLSRQSLDEKSAGIRVELKNDKRNPSDFALWKFSGTDEKRQMEWDSPWGVGFPGWHIECSAMSTTYLGQPFDIHTGGIDLIAVHHENEIAQSTAANDMPLARFWIHGEFVILDDQKMAKSDGNIITIAELREKGFDPLSYRYLLLQTHYRSPLSFSMNALASAEHALHNIRDIVRMWEPPAQHIDNELMEQFTTAIQHDINMPQALACMWELIKSDKKSAIKSRTLLAMDNMLGLRLERWIAVPNVIPSEIIKLANERESARHAEEFIEADRLRLLIEEKGYGVNDTAQGYTIVEK